MLGRLNLTDTHVNLGLRTLLSTAFKPILSGVSLLMIIYFPFLIEKLRLQFLFLNPTGKNIEKPCENKPM